MSRCIAFLIALAFAVPSFAFDMPLIHVKKKAAAGAPAPSYLFEENFDGATACGAGTADSNCNNGWTNVSGSGYNFNYSTSPAPLQGSKSLVISAAGVAATIAQIRNTTNFTTASPIYLHAQFNITTIDNTPASTQKIVSFGNSAGTVFCDFGIRNNSGVKFVLVVGGTATYATSPTPTAGQTYHVWMKFTKGASSNASAQVWISTDGTKPGSATIEKTGVTSDNDGVRVYLSAYAAQSDEVIFDRILVDDVDIGSNP